MGLQGSKTEKNLLASFAGESQARNRYTYFASVAKKEGYEQIAALFLETADNEKEHAKKFFKPFDEIPYQTVIKGDNKYLSIAAASVLAKTHRDKLMQN